MFRPGHFSGVRHFVRDRQPVTGVASLTLAACEREKI
jgi:hypothetical protein